MSYNIEFIKASVEGFKDETLVEVLTSDGNFKGKKLILYFYPADNTPTCTVESCNLRDNFSDLTKAGYAVLGVSPDSARKHQNFIKNLMRVGEVKINLTPS